MTEGTDITHEFSSIQVVLDHLSLNSEGKLSQKFVLTEQSVDEALVALLKYYGMEAVLASASGIAIVRESANFDTFALVLATPDNFQVLMSLESWGTVCEQFGNNQYQAVDYLSKVVADLVSKAIQEQGSPRSLTLLALDTEATEEADA